MNVAAQALEKSVLETKDKDQLLAIAKALGLKATARSKKSDIIDQILDMTGAGAAAAAPRGKICNQARLQGPYLNSHRLATLRHREPPMPQLPD